MVIKNVPVHIKNEVAEVISKVQNDDFLDTYYQPKIQYINAVLVYLENSVEKWIDDLANIPDSQKFDWLDMKPVIKNPNDLV